MVTDSIDVCITFDTTGSMYPCLTQVRRSVEQTVKKLFSDIPDLRIAIIAHGDYCDAPSYRGGFRSGRETYVTKISDFSNNVNEITNFVKTVGQTHGGDFPECYELVLNEARTKLKWGSGRKKVIVMIGDATPHPPQYDLNVNNIDWRNELGLLLEAGINVYGVHAMPGMRQVSKQFYTEIAEKTGGFYLTLDQFSVVNDLIIGVCYKQQDEEDVALMDWVQVVKDSGRMTASLQNSFSEMSGGKIEKMEIVNNYHTHHHHTPTRVRIDVEGEKVDSVPEGLVPVEAGRFQVIPVDGDISIKNFVEEQGITFKAGRGFYELTKSVKVQQYKEIVLVDRSNWQVFNGTEVRKLLGLKEQCVSKGVTERLKPADFEKYRVFIQSTSYNRKLLAGTSLLYEVE